MKRHLYPALFSSTILFLISCSHVAPVTAPDTKAEVATLSAKWEQAFQEDDPDKVAALYAKDAVLWGTLSPKRRDDPAAIRDYFVGAFKALPGHKVTFGDQLIRVYGNTAVNTGYYTVWYTKDGETKSVPARYSFTYRKEGDKWLIADHHSSAMPPAPK
ncbi:MAG: SgcJ/EcaC family oxidoreductase [Acidobacteriota bacterium]|nr:SgcJ/EcaC family oxidoreductase [Acidobacteriota bacterium]